MHECQASLLGHALKAGSIYTLKRLTLLKEQSIRKTTASAIKDLAVSRVFLII
ncbi:hypothetical protein SAMN05216352_109131 [Alteribacillus bidgolensis]|uniref:Uncharacterized protein n=1 Tax=Alteribacillus bidgolensis TaxID=930129 RepID=A0A1G8LYG0_9BACI|nr:hypothetical protein SAMN05216352_109131 [Alteribacillus bidgolensis]